MSEQEIVSTAKSFVIGLLAAGGVVATVIYLTKPVEPEYV